MSDVALPSSNMSGVRSKDLRQDERSRSVHARLHLVDQEQVTPAFAGRVEMADHAFRDRRTPPTDWINSTCTTANSCVSKSASI